MPLWQILEIVFASGIVPLLTDPTLRPLKPLPVIERPLVQQYHDRAVEAVAVPEEARCFVQLGRTRGGDPLEGWAMKTATTMVELQKRMGQIFAAARRRGTLSMLDVSAKCGFSEGYYGMIERGRRRASGEALLKIFDVLGVSSREQRDVLALLGRSLVEDAVHKLPEAMRRDIVATLFSDCAGPAKDPALVEALVRVERLYGTDRWSKLLSALHLVDDQQGREYAVPPSVGR